MNTRIFQMRAKSPSIRTTIPVAIAEYLNLQGGEEINWSQDVKDGKRSVVVTKVG